MKKHLAGFLGILFFGALLSGGCAKQELVRRDDPVAPVAPAVTKQAEKAPKADPGIPTSTIKEATVVATAAPQGSQKGSEMIESQATEQLTSALDKIYFAFDSATLSEQARATLTKGAEFMKKNSASRIRVEGHCDERGSDEYNLALGEKRAKAALNYLVTLGIPAGRLSVISYGKEKPATAGHDESAWALNRRDELMVVTK